MDIYPKKTGDILEDKLLRHGLYFGLAVVSLLLVYDFFFTKDYDSVILELATGVFFISLIFTTHKYKTTATHRLLMSVILFIIINVAWLTGSGVNIINAGIYFVAIVYILIINENKYHVFILPIVAIDLIFLFVWEYFFYEGYEWKEVAHLTITTRYIGVLIFFVVGLYFIEFLKINYQDERNKLYLTNTVLQEKSDKVALQNRKLRIAGKQMQAANARLKRQREELITIKKSLEKTVEERTEHLKKVNKKLSAQNKQLEQFAYITSHNLRSPAAQIKSLSTLIISEFDNEEVAKTLLKRLEESTGQLLQVVEDLGAILKVKQDIQQALEDIDIIEEAKAIIKTLQTVIAEKNIKIKMPAVKHLKIKGVRAYIYSILHNLIENAIKYSDPAKDSFVKIAVDEIPGYHKISIIDNGIGMDMGRVSEKIFQMYQRFTDRESGHGFGLFLVRTQIEAMDGRIEVESVLGQGTAFHLYFPKQD